MTDPTPIVAALDRAGYRLTEPRRSLAALIAEQDGHFTAAELVAAAACQLARASGAPPSSARSRSSRRSAPSNVSTSRLASTPMSAASRPTTTTSSARAAAGPAEIDDAGLRSVVRDVARQTGFRVDDHRLELFGLCPDCQATADGGARCR